MCGRSTQRILGVTSEEDTAWRSVEGLRLIIYLQEVTTLLSTCIAATFNACHGCTT